MAEDTGPVIDITRVIGSGCFGTSFLIKVLSQKRRTETPTKNVYTEEDSEMW